MYKYIVILFLVFTQNTFAQTLDAQENIKMLQSGFLLVEIPTDFRKIKELDKVLAKNPSTRTQELKDYAIEENKKVQEGIIAGIQKKYTFSKVVMVYDSAENVFYDKDLNKIPDFSLKNQKYLIFRYKNWIKSETYAKLTFLICGADKIPLAEPFPSKLKHKFFVKKVLKPNAAFLSKLSDDERRKYEKIYWTWSMFDKNPYVAAIAYIDLRLFAFLNQ